MASDVRYYGAIAKGTSCGHTRSVQKSDNTTLEVEIIGKYSTIENIVIQSEPGDSLTANDAQGDSFLGFKVKTMKCDRAEGGVGILRASLVRASGASSPYHITYAVDMQEVQKNLIAHPLFRRHPSALKYITMWNETAAGSRVVWGASRDEDKFYYLDSDTSSSDYNTLQEITDEYAVKYCKAAIAGIETYNEYLPVVSKVSLYLKEPPGLSQNATTHALTGTLRYSTNIGKWDSSFGFAIQGYSDSSTGGWFKSEDRWGQNADGTWQREEEWVYTNDKTHSWIYEGAD